MIERGLIDSKLKIFISSEPYIQNNINEVGPEGR
jgi:hypothetical protein